MTDEKMVRVRYEPDESGWAADLGDGTYRIANVPLAKGLNVDDVVTVRHEDGLMIVDQVVRRGDCDRKVMVWYDTRDQYKAVFQALVDLGCKCEGVAGPSDRGRGAMLVAAPVKVDVRAVARACGVVDPESEDAGRSPGWPR